MTSPRTAIPVMPLRPAEVYAADTSHRRYRRLVAAEPLRSHAEVDELISSRTFRLEAVPYTSQTAIAGASRRAFSVAVGRSASGV